MAYYTVVFVGDDYTVVSALAVIVSCSPSDKSNDGSSDGADALCKGQGFSYVPVMFLCTFVLEGWTGVRRANKNKNWCQRFTTAVRLSEKKTDDCSFRALEPLVGVSRSDRETVADSLDILHEEEFDENSRASCLSIFCLVCEVVSDCFF